MESNRKRRGFTKGKQLVMSIYKGTSRSSSSKVKLSPSLSPAAAHHHVVGGGFINVNQLHEVITQAPKQQKVLPPPPPHHLEFILNQDQVVPQSKQKVSFLFPADVGVGGRRQYNSYRILDLHDNRIIGEFPDFVTDRTVVAMIVEVKEDSSGSCGGNGFWRRPRQQQRRRWKEKKEKGKNPKKNLHDTPQFFDYYIEP